MLEGPIVGSYGRPLTRLARIRALVVVPSEIPKDDRPLIVKAFGLGTMPASAVLVRLTSSQETRWAHKNVPGIHWVVAQEWLGRSEVGTNVVKWAAIQDGDVGTLIERRTSSGSYEVANAIAHVASVNVALSQHLGALMGARGSVVVVNHRGQVLAAVDTNRELMDAGVSVGMADFPPLLAVALHDPSVQKVVQENSASLSRIVTVWGPGRMRSGIQELGLLASPLWKVASPSQVGAVNGAQVVTGTSQVRVSPLAVARTYLPFVNGGRDTSLLIGTETAHPHRMAARLNAAMFREVLGQLPVVRDNGHTYRVWRPDSRFAVLIDERGGYVAVLEGTAAKKSLSILALLATEGVSLH